MMIKKLIIATFAITMIFSAPVYPEGLTDEVSENPSEKEIYDNLAFEWLKGNMEIPVEDIGIPISIPIIKEIYDNLALEWLRGNLEIPVENEVIPTSGPITEQDGEVVNVVNENSKIDAISYVHKQQNRKPDSVTGKEVVNENLKTDAISYVNKQQNRKLDSVAAKEVVNENLQIDAISYVLKQHNRYLDSVTAIEYAKIIKSTSEKYGEDPFVIAALIVVESRAKHDAKSKDGDFGLMQVRWRVHKNKLIQKFPTINTESDMFKPVENILAGTEILSNYKKYANGDIEIAMKAYSGGSSTHWAKVYRVVEKIRIKYNEFSKGVV